MKCPICGDPVGTDEKGIYCCDECYGEFPYLDRLIDPTELMRMIEEAQDQALFCTPRGRDIYHENIIEAIKSYLSGDHEPLKKLEEAER